MVSAGDWHPRRSYRTLMRGVPVKKVCIVNACPDDVWANGLCSMHYQRVRRTGKLERLCKCGAEPANGTGKVPLCVECKKASKRRTRRSADLRRAYGITLARYEEMLVSQNGKCAVCGTNDPGRGHPSFCVDHNHATGVVRGLLCHRCNAAIGLLGDDPQTILMAAKYLGA